jgi:hypothetical protein
MKIRSCHGGIPDLSSGRTERRDRKKEVDMMSKLHPCLRAIPSARGTFGISMKPKRMRTRAENALHRQAAEMLRRKGYQRRIVMLSSDDALPYDRPNLSKDYLAGAIPFDFVPFGTRAFMRKMVLRRILARRLSRSMCGLAKSSSPATRGSLTTSCYWQRELSRFVSRSPGRLRKRLRRPWRRGKAQDHELSDPNP